MIKLFTVIITLKVFVIKYYCIRNEYLNLMIKESVKWKKFRQIRVLIERKKKERKTKSPDKLVK